MATMSNHEAGAVHQSIVIGEGDKEGIGRRRKFFRVDDATGRGNYVHWQLAECIERALQHLRAALLENGAEAEEHDGSRVIVIPRESGRHGSSFGGQHGRTVDNVLPRGGRFPVKGLERVHVKEVAVALQGVEIREAREAGPLA